EEADRRPPTELVVEAEQQERDDRHRRDRHVLPFQVRSRALLDGALDLAHALVAGRPAEQPDGQPDAVGDRDPRAYEREEHRVVVEEAPDDQRSYPLTRSAPSVPGAGRFLSHGARQRLARQAGGPRARAAR